jgi:hypothetical protein
MNHIIDFLLIKLDTKEKVQIPNTLTFIIQNHKAKNISKKNHRNQSIRSLPNRTRNNSDRNPIGKSIGIPLENVPKFRVHNLTP